ncbi:MAG: hypothetical protein HZB25_10610 [Candidatus Eisenbacteria bacterium]|nr:hypothetical protein [Candidatus Eisenbacteria bacterium]
MRKFVTIAALLVVALMAPMAAFAQEEAHYEGYTRFTNPSLPGTVINGRGLVTALYPPLVSAFSTHEYTWEMLGLTSLGSVLRDSVYTTTYSVAGSSFSIYEDPSFDASAGFYNCPSTAPDAAFNNGVLYLRGHFTSFRTTFDIHYDVYGQGTFTAQLNWDTGSHIGDLPPARRGAWTFGGSTVSSYACIPPTYDQQMTGRIFQLTTPVSKTTWGQVRRLYQ